MCVWALNAYSLGTVFCEISGVTCETSSLLGFYVPYKFGLFFFLITHQKVSTVP